MTEKGQLNLPDKKQMINIMVSLILYVIVSLLPPPTGLGFPAMCFLGTMVFIIYSVSTGALEEYVAVLFGMIILTITKSGTFTDVFNGFGSTTLILLIGAFATGGILAECGALSRASNTIVRLFPETYFGRMISMYLTNLIITPMFPSTSAKGIIAGLITTATSKEMGYKAKSAPATGLFLAGYIPACVLGAAFFSGMLYGPILAGMTDDAQLLTQFSWGTWAMSSIVWLIVMLALCIPLTYYLYKPKDGDIDYDLRAQFTRDDSKKEKMTQKQMVAIAVIISVLVFWIFGKKFGIAEYQTAILGFLALVLLGVTDAKTAMKNHIPWGSLMFCAFVVGIPKLIESSGLSAWLGDAIYSSVAPLVASPFIFLALICIACFIVRLVVISQTMVVTTVYLLMAPVAIMGGYHPWVIGFVTIACVATWNTIAQNLPFLICYNAGDQYADYGKSFKMSIATMFIIIIAVWASIPFWKAIGLI